MTDAPPPPAPRDAASLILLRREGADARVLMGQRGRTARFMPSKYVFPGGALDPADHDPTMPAPLEAACLRRLAERAPEGVGPALARAALRETREETGLALGEAARIRFIFRAITPPTRPVRFDARFFLADAAALESDPEDFSRAEDELTHLSWLTLAEARRLDLPFITSVILAEVEARLDDLQADRSAPFFHHADGRSFVDALQ